MLKTYKRALILVSIATLPSCIGAQAIVGIGGSAIASHAINGITYKTYTAPYSRIRWASMKAISNMGLKKTGEKKDPQTSINTVTAVSKNMEFEIAFEEVSDKTTKVRIIARKNKLFFDQATANAMHEQIQKLI